MKLNKDFEQLHIPPGLATQEAHDRLAADGYNQLPPPPELSLAGIFIHQFASPLIYLLAIAAVFKLIYGSLTEAVAIGLVILVNAAIGTYQELKTAQKIKGLQRLLITEAVVIRDGKPQIVQEKYLVVQDLIELTQGDRIPADCKVVACENFSADESILTGESIHVAKKIGDPVYQATFVTTGTARCVVVATGQATQVGQLNKALSSISTESPLDASFKRLSRLILVTALVATTGLLLITLLHGTDLYSSVDIMVALFVSIIPEGLPIAVTVTLISGVYAMAKSNVLVKNAKSLDALGRASAILTDKTGTLTKNQMMVTSIYAAGKNFTVIGSGYDPVGTIVASDGSPIQQVPDEFELIGLASHACSVVLQLTEDGLYKLKGDPTEAAILVLAEKIRSLVDFRTKPVHTIHKQPFDNVVRFGAAAFDYAHTKTWLIIGSPEHIMSRCTQSSAAHAQQALASMLSKGLRVVAVGQVDYKNEESLQDLSQVRLVGLLGMQDAVRLDVQENIQRAQQLGIHIAVVTGDHQQTAFHVAQAAGIAVDEKNCITGDEFAALIKQDQRGFLNDKTVYARFTPQQKQELVTLFQQRGDIVAMTGDGVNDAPSLAQADAGIALGLSGSDVAKSAAGILLLDDSFNGIVLGVMHGRHLYNNLRRVVLYLLSTSMCEFLVIGYSIVVLKILPLTAVQILWLNLVTDGIFTLPIIMEEPEEHVLATRDWQTARLFSPRTIHLLVLMSIAMTISGILAMYLYQGAENLRYLQTIVFTVLAASQWVNAINCRSEYASSIAGGLAPNWWLAFSFSAAFVLQLILVYSPINAFLGLMPLTWYDFVVSMALAGIVMLATEIFKFCRR